MENFDLKKFLTENKLTASSKLAEDEGAVKDPSSDIQSTLKFLAGYWPVDIKNNLDKLGAEEFKKQLDNLKPYIDQYFKSKN